MDERDALMELDRRMREATAELRRAVDAAIGDNRPTATTNGVRPTAPGGPASVEVDHSALAARSHLRWLLAAAAATLVAVGVAGIVLVNRGDDDTPPATTVEQPFLVPDWLPAGWGRGSAVLGGAQSGLAPKLTVYGTSTSEAPGEGDIVAVLRVDGSEDLDPDARTVDVAGHDATVDRDGDNWTVTVPMDEQTVVVSGRGVTRDVMLNAATAAVNDEPIESVLPGGFANLTEGLVDLARTPAAGSLSLEYDGGGAEQSLTIIERPGASATEVGLVRYLLPAANTATEITVRGQPGVHIDLGSTPDDPRGVVQWLEPPGLLVTLWYEGLNDDGLYRVIARMRSSPDAEINQLVGSFEGPSAATDDLEPGEVVVAEGDRGSNHWRVTAKEDRRSFEVSYEDDYEGFGLASVTEGDSGMSNLEFYAGDESDARGEIPMIGTVSAAITDVVVETDGQPPLPVSLYRHEDLTRTIIVGFIPDSYKSGDVVGRNRRGREIARIPVGDPRDPVAASAGTTP